MNVRNLNTEKIAIIGMGYVGLPLAIEFGKIQFVTGFDISASRVSELINFFDKTLECSEQDIRESVYLHFSSEVESIKDASVFIVAVPTPVDNSNTPDFSALISACKLVASILKKEDIVIFESTVYPGATEEVCVPILASISGLKFNVDFYCGYSPERINPGDKTRRLANICKITSGSTPEIAIAIDNLYKSIIVAGTHMASSIKIAEAAKVIENTQRDVNIALMNELSFIFNKLGIDTTEVLDAASTKWNFLPFRPGLVGGHCIGVDPYYLTHKAQQIGYHPEVILAGRRINDRMGHHIANQTIKLMSLKGVSICSSNILILGLTFKENCPDIRNTKVIDIIDTLISYGASVDIYDPWVSNEDALYEFNLNCLNSWPDKIKYSAIIIAVAHQEFIAAGVEFIRSLGVDGVIIFDVKAIFPKKTTHGRL